MKKSHKKLAKEFSETLQEIWSWKETWDRETALITARAFIEITAHSLAKTVKGFDREEFLTRAGVKPRCDGECEHERDTSTAG